MPLSFDHSMRTKRGRIARQPRLYLGKRAAAWVKVETASSAPEPVPRFLELPDALGKDEPDHSAQHPHTFQRYCIRQGWPDRV
jgi:hypothetical protein